MTSCSIVRPAWCLVCLSVLACGPTVYPVPRDMPGWLGVARSQWGQAYIDEAALSDTGSVVVTTLRSVSAYSGTGQFGGVRPRSSELRLTLHIDCARKQARQTETRWLDAAGVEVERQVIDAAPWQAFESGLPLRQICIRLGRVPGRLAPN